MLKKISFQDEIHMEEGKAMDNQVSSWNLMYVCNDQLVRSDFEVKLWGCTLGRLSTEDPSTFVAALTAVN